MDIFDAVFFCCIIIVQAFFQIFVKSAKTETSSAGEQLVRDNADGSTKNVNSKGY